MMKTCLYFTVLLFFLGSYVVHGQTVDGKHDLRFQLSDGIPLSLINGITIGLSDAFSNSYADYKIKRTGETALPLVYGLGYRHWISPRFNAGLDVAFMHFKADYELTKGSDTKYGARKTNYILLLPAAEYLYMNKQKVKLYGNAAAGVTVFSGSSTVGGGDANDYNSTVFAFQLNPIAVRVGERFGGFAELGFGFKGFVTLGFSARL